jgi:hypothetical protein
VDSQKVLVDETHCHIKLYGDIGDRRFLKSIGRGKPTFNFTWLHLAVLAKLREITVQ